MSRLSIKDFQLANPLYRNASVYFYTVSAGVKTSTLATLYSATTGSAQLANPQKLSSAGRFRQAVYVEDSVIATVVGISTPSHDTGIINGDSDAADAAAASVLTILADTTDADNGDERIGVKSSLTGGIARTQHDKNEDIVSVSDFASIQAAATAIGANGSVYLPEGTHTQTASVTLAEGTKIYGPGPEACTVYRTGDYGSTFICGSTDLSAPARACEIRGIKFKHSTPFSTGDTSLANLATTGSHLVLRGAQNAIIDNCWFWRMPYNIQFVGGSLTTITNCQFLGTWDDQTVALKEGIASIDLRYSAVHGNPTTFVIMNNKFFGATVTRNVTYNPSSGASIVNRVDTIGTKYGIFTDGVEDFVVANNYFGGQSVAHIAVVNATGAAAIDWRIYGNMFDGISQGQAILFAPTVANLFTLGVQITNNNFVDNLHSVFVNYNTGSTTPAVYNLGIKNNTMIAGIGTPIYLNGASGFRVSGNEITNYNVHAITTVDKLYASAVYATGVSEKGSITQNEIGGGGNTLTNTSGTNYCYFGIEVDSTLTSVKKRDNNYLGIRTGSTFYTGHAISENQYILTAAGNYQMVDKDDVVLVKKSVGAATTIYLPANPVLGREAEVIDDKGDASSNNITISVSDGSSIVGTALISADYGAARFRWNGTRWNRGS